MDLSQDMKDAGFVYRPPNLPEKLPDPINITEFNLGWERKWISKEEAKKLYPDNQDDPSPDNP